MLLSASVVLLIGTVPLRLVKAVLRLRFMSDHYDGYRAALTQDFWFSESWWEYVGTPLGLTMTLAPLVMIAGSVGCLGAATRC